MRINSLVSMKSKEVNGDVLESCKAIPVSSPKVQERLGVVWLLRDSSVQQASQNIFSLPFLLERDAGNCFSHAAEFVYSISRLRHKQSVLRVSCSIKTAMCVYSLKTQKAQKGEEEGPGHHHFGLWYQNQPKVGCISSPPQAKCSCIFNSWSNMVKRSRSSHHRTQKDIF